MALTRLFRNEVIKNMSDKLKRLFIPGIIDALLPTVEWVQELLGGKVDKVTGKGLSTNDYTTEEKEKLSGIAAGAEVNAVTSVNGMTGAVSIQTGGNVDSVNGKTGVVTLTASDVGALPSNTPIPSAVTEQTVAGWGFTKNTGTYSKPSGGIPDSDIASAATWNAKGTYSKPSGGIPKTDFDSAVQTSLNKADTALQDGVNLTNNLGFCYVNVGAGQTTTELIGTNANYVPKNGGIVVGRFLVDVPSNATINISGRGAKAVYFRNSAIAAGTIKSGDVAAFVYYPDRYYLISIDRWQTDIKAIQNAGYQTAQDVSLAILAADPPLELIRTYTCDGTETTTSAFYITEDDDGNPFRLKRLVMRVTLGTVSASGTFSANALSGSKIIAQSYSSYGASASGQRYLLNSRQDGGYWRMEQFGFSSATGNIGFNNEYSFRATVYDYPYIDRVRLTRAVPAGTVIELFGVPYDSNGIQPAESNSFGGGA